jgi:hypothetical protein
VSPEGNPYRADECADENEPHPTSSLAAWASFDLTLQDADDSIPLFYFFRGTLRPLRLLIQLLVQVPDNLVRLVNFRAHLEVELIEG